MLAFGCAQTEDRVVAERPCYVQGYCDQASVIAAAERVLAESALRQTRCAFETAPAIHVRRFGVSRRGHRVLRDVSFDVRKGEIAVLCGPRGCGSKTMLAALGRTLRGAESLNVAGEIEIAGVDVYRDADVERAHAMAATVFFGGRPEQASVRSALSQPLRERGITDERAIADAIARCLALMDAQAVIGPHMEESASSLSDANCRLVAIARAFLKNPQVILVEEPLRGLCAKQARLVEGALSNLACKANIAVVAETSDSVFAQKAAHRILFFLQGELVESLPAARMAHVGADYRTRAFLEGRMR